MDIKVIKQLVEIFEKSSLSIMDTTDGEFKLRLEKNIGCEAQPIVQRTAPVVNALPTPAPILEQTGGVVDFNGITEIKSPMVGVFYTAPSPGAKPYVTRGSKVKKGDILCIIEAMKLMNEILAETDGEIVDVCAENGEVVEFSQVLYKLF